jgi:hypothetical protein
MDVSRVLSSNQLLGLVLTLALALFWHRNRPLIREFTSDTDRGWPTVSKIAGAMLAVTIAWISLFDNWRELTAIPFRATRQWDYQRVAYAPTSDGVRTVTTIIGVITLIALACLVARHVGGYVLQVVIALGAFGSWIPFFVIRQRFTMDLALGFSGDSRSVADVGGYVAFVLISWGFDLGLIVVSAVAAVAVVALPVTFALDLLRLRRRKVTAEAQPFFNAIGHRSAH